MSRICLITHSGYPTEPRARRMAEALARRVHSVDVLCLQMEGQAALEALAGVQVVRLPETRHQGAGAPAYLKEYARFFWLAGREVRRRHAMAPYDVVQVHNPPDALIFCTLPLRLSNRRPELVLDLRELMPELFMSRFGLARKSAVVRVLTLLERLACGYACAVLVLHERHRRIMARRGVPDAKMTQVMNCPDDSYFDGATPIGARPNGSFRVIHHGGILHRFGVDVLVEAVALARQEVPEIRLELYGAGDYRPELERTVERLGLADVVTFHGQRPLEEMPAAIAAADVGVGALRQDVFTDCALPTKLLEYVAMGVPAIAARTATTADYFDESMVLLFEPGNPADLARRLVAVRCDPAAAQARALAARRFTAEHNWASEGGRYVQLIERLAKTSEERAR